jgi:hypothetical protein
MWGPSLADESRGIEAKPETIRETTMQSNLIPFLAADDSYRRDRARRYFAAAAKRRAVRRRRSRA